MLAKDPNLAVLLHILQLETTHGLLQHGGNRPLALRPDHAFPHKRYKRIGVLFEFGASGFAHLRLRSDLVRRRIGFGTGV